jgi:hypothetical protein
MAGQQLLEAQQVLVVASFEQFADQRGGRAAASAPFLLRSSGRPVLASARLQH